MSCFFDETIPQHFFFKNAPGCRTRRAAAKYYQVTKTFSEPQPQTDALASVLHQIDHPHTLGSVLDRQVSLQEDGRTIQKSVRIGGSDFRAEKRCLDMIKASTLVPVPSVYLYQVSTEFEHLFLENISGTTLETVWPTLSRPEQDSIADEVVSLINQLRKIQSPRIESALLDRQPLRAGLRNATDLNLERIKRFQLRQTYRKIHL